MFQFPAFASLLGKDDWPSARRVVPFGNHRVKGYLLLTGAYRSLSRPSSPPRAKASAVRPSILSRSTATLACCCSSYFQLYSCPQYHKDIKNRNLSLRYLQSCLCQYVKDLFKWRVKREELIFHFSFFTFLLLEWRITDSNRWPPACKAGALASWANPPNIYYLIVIIFYLKDMTFKY